MNRTDRDYSWIRPIGAYDSSREANGSALNQYWETSDVLTMSEILQIIISDSNNPENRGDYIGAFFANQYTSLNTLRPDNVPQNLADYIFQNVYPRIKILSVHHHVSDMYTGPILSNTVKSDKCPALPPHHPKADFVTRRIYSDLYGQNNVETHILIQFKSCTKN